MKQHIDLNLLKQVDETTEERIAEEFPINLEIDERFERAYQNYLEKSQKSETSAKPIKHYKLRFISAVACCVLVLGAAFAFRIPAHQIPSIPSETVTEATTNIPPSESTTNPIAAEKTKPETSPLQTDEDTSVTESKNDALVIPALTESSVTDATELQTAPKETSEMKIPDETEQLVIIVTEPKITDTAKRIFKPPPADTETQSTEPPVLDTPEPTKPTQPFVTEILEPTQPSASESIDPTQPTEPELLPGFDVVDHGENLEVIYREELAPSPEEIQAYSLSSEQFQLVSTRIPEEPSPKSIKYKVWLPEKDRYFTVRQVKRDCFSYFCESDVMLYSVEINGYPGCVAVSPDESCTLYWDDGQYTFTIWGTLQNQEVMMQIAEAFTENVIELTAS